VNEPSASLSASSFSLPPFPVRQRLGVLGSLAAYAARATLRQPACRIFVVIAAVFFAVLATGLIEPPSGLRLSVSLFLLAFVSVGAAGVVPALIDEGTMRLLLTKPASRAGLLLALMAGVAGAGALIALGTGTALWFAEGLRTGARPVAGLIQGVPLAICTALFACWLVLVGVVSQSAMAAALAGVLHVFFFSTALALLHGGGAPGVIEIQSVPLKKLVDALFYLLPDLLGMLGQGMKFARGDAASLAPFGWGALSAVGAAALAVLSFRRADF
jgi:ABC-type transport system involved in multi-copper enzyme maturation permease subunit